MDDAEFDREALQELISQIPPDKIKDPVTIPLVIYVGVERHVIGEAVVVGDKIISYVAKENSELLKFLGSCEHHYMSISTEPSELIPTIEHGFVTPVRITQVTVAGEDTDLGIDHYEDRYPTLETSALPQDFDEKLKTWDQADLSEYPQELDKKLNDGEDTTDE